MKSETHTLDLRFEITGGFNQIAWMAQLGMEAS